MRTRRGFLLIAALMITVILAIMGMGFLGQRISQYKGAARCIEAGQARALARAGIEDARIKLEKDPEFPPPSGNDQTVFTYSENVMDAGQTVGVYTVSVDTTYKEMPWQVIRIKSVGEVGPRQAPIAQATIQADLDLSTVDPNRTYRFLRWQESASP